MGMLGGAPAPPRPPPFASAFGDTDGYGCDHGCDQPLFEESNKTNTIFALQYPPKVHLSRDVYSNSLKSGWSFFQKN